MQVGHALGLGEEQRKFIDASQWPETPHKAGSHLGHSIGNLDLHWSGDIDRTIVEVCLDQIYQTGAVFDEMVEGNGDVRVALAKLGDVGGQLDEFHLQQGDIAADAVDLLGVDQTGVVVITPNK